MARAGAARAPKVIAAAQPPRPAGPWIFDAPRDLALLVGAPLWILPLVYVAAALATDRAVNTAIMALGAIGHHLPGMLRAYGDRALFARYRVRFVVAPLALALLCSTASVRGLHAVVLTAFVWGVWHAFMQSYGFARIYASKSGRGDAVSSWLDFSLLAAWFAAGVAWSPLRVHFILDLGATSGVPLPSVAVLEGVRTATGVAAALATVAWLGWEVKVRRGGAPRGGLRVALLVSSIAFWWVANVRVAHPLLGMPLFELFHDVQYLAIVWAFNRRRLDQAGRELSPWLGALSRPGAGTIALYVVACAGYGALAFVQPAGALGPVWSALIGASQLLHFYYDGFIWRVREPATAKTLGLTDGDASGALRPAWRHALTWSLLLGSSAALAWGETVASVPEAERIPALARLVPDNVFAVFADAELHWQHQEPEEALDGFRRTLALDPTHAGARDNLALSLSELADGAARANAEPELRLFITELEALRPTLSGDVARWVDERLQRHGARAHGGRSP